MSVETLPEVQHEGTGGADLGHIVCCDEDRALCGFDVTNEPWDYHPRHPCVVCVGLDGTPCGPDCEWNSPPP